MTDRLPLWIGGRRVWTEAPENLPPEKVAEIIADMPKGDAVDESRVDRAVRQAESVNLRGLARLHLDRLRAVLGSMDVADYVDEVEMLRDGEGDEAGARIYQLCKYPPGTTDPAA